MALHAVIACAALWAGTPTMQSDLAGAQARVETLYAAGSLPEALRAAREGLQVHPDDPVLLRRACQLALSLRAPELAAEPVRRLGELAREGRAFPSDRVEAWRGEAASFALELGRLEEREHAVERATFRSRVVSISTVLVLGAAILALAKGNRPPPAVGGGR